MFRIGGEEIERGVMYVSGAESRPTRNASEKFRVARAERYIPRRRREKAFMSVYCWFVGRK